MKSTSKILLLLISIICLLSLALKTKTPTALDNIRPYLLAQIDTTIATLRTLQHEENLNNLKTTYHTARKYYKHIEFFVEYNSPYEAKYSINGALVPKYDQEYGNQTTYPNGFQKIEELIYAPENETVNTKELNTNIIDLIEALLKIKTYYASIVIDDALLAEMLQVELYRITALNLSGYDATISKTSIAESADCIEGLQQLLQAFLPQSSAAINEYNSTLQNLQNAQKALLKHIDYDSFDRLNFISKHINPLNISIIKWHTKAGIQWSDRKQALHLQQPYLFSEAALNKNYFSIYYNDTVNQVLQTQLGKQLFFDKSFSANKKVACASCHQPNKAFTDGLKTAMGLQNILLDRNTPTLLNVIYQKAFFADGRVYQLEQQSADVMHNKLEMGANITNTIAGLQNSKAYKLAFAKAFKGTPDTVISDYSVFKALAEYEKTLTNLNTRFDKYLQGNTAALNTKEIKGYNLFAGKALCGSCHFMPLFNGTVPPFFNDSEYEIIGTPATADNKSLDADEGRYKITKAEVQRFAFKTPTLRNVINTAPYMHNGVYKTLDEVIEFYHKGGGKGLGYDVPNQTLPFDSLQLNKNEKECIKAFLKTL